MIFTGTTCGYNLLLGGIDQDEPCVEPCSSAANNKYKEIAASLDAYYFPMYNQDRGSNIEEVRNASLGVATEQNGLKNGALNNHHYETIVAYSGGTSTAVTALADKANYGLTCDKLVLVSPMAAGIRLDMPETSGASPEGELVIDILQIAADIENAKSNFKKQVDEIRANNPNIKIIVIQSQDDKPSLLSDTYQYRFDGKDPGIEVHEVDLTKTGEDAHREIFFNYAASHLANDGNGITFSPTGQSTKPNPFEQKNSDEELRNFNLLLENMTSFFKSITPEQPPIFGNKELSGAQGEALFKHLTTGEGSKTQANVQPTPVSNSQDTKEEELRRKLQYINSWFAAGAPGLS